MKKGFIICLAIIVFVAVGWQVYVWRNSNMQTNPSHQGSKDVKTPVQNGRNHENPQKGNDQDKDASVFDILGQSNNLTPQQWAAMQEWRGAAKLTAQANSQLVFINGQGKKPQVALTFDDGPDETITPEVLEILKQNHVHATFFVKANRLYLFRDLMKNAYANGNQIASHAYSHQELNKMSPEDIDKEILASDQAFRQVLGVEPAMIRPPFGAISQEVLNVCQKEQENIILWSIDTLDWSQPEPEHIAQNVLDNVRPGEIILMHSCEGRAATVQALPIIIKGLQEKGYEMVDLAELLGKPAYKAN